MRISLLSNNWPLFILQLFTIFPFNVRLNRNTPLIFFTASTLSAMRSLILRNKESLWSETPPTDVLVFLWFFHLLQIDVSTSYNLHASLSDTRLEMNAWFILPHFDFECLAWNGGFRETNFNRFEQWRIVVGVSLQNGSHWETKSAQTVHDWLLLAANFREIWIDVHRIQITG